MFYANRHFLCVFFNNHFKFLILKVVPNMSVFFHAKELSIKITDKLRAKFSIPYFMFCLRVN